MSGVAVRPLGGSGIDVAPIGFGSWAIGGPHTRDGAPVGWGPVDDNESIAAVSAALEGGMTFFDTADVYGCGHSERILGKALAGRDDVVIATKFGYTYDEATRESPGTDASDRYIRWACEQSLRRLGRETIDLYFFHLGGYPIESAADVVATLEDLADQGKIRSFGWSTDDPDRAEYIAGAPRCAAVEQAFNVFEGNAQTLDVCERHGLASVVRSPLGMGLLTGKITRATTFEASDLRTSWDLDGRQGQRLDALDEIRDILTRDGRTLAQGALGWLLARSKVFVPIPGVRTVAQAEDSAGTLSFGPLTAAQLGEVDAALARAGEAADGQS